MLNLCCLHSIQYSEVIPNDNISCHGPGSVGPVFVNILSISLFLVIFASLL